MNSVTFSHSCSYQYQRSSAELAKLYQQIQLQKSLKSLPSKKAKLAIQTKHDFVNPLITIQELYNIVERSLHDLHFIYQFHTQTHYRIPRLRMRTLRNNQQVVHRIDSADDCTIFRNVSSQQDQISLQRDLNRVDSEVAFGTEHY